MGKPLKEGPHRVSIKKSVYQFCIDHCVYKGTDGMTIKFVITGFGDLWRRIEARERGLYRNTQDQIENGQQKKRDELWFFKQMQKEHDDVVNKIKAQGTIKQKLILWLYRQTRKYLFKR